MYHYSHSNLQWSISLLCIPVLSVCHIRMYSNSHTHGILTGECKHPPPHTHICLTLLRYVWLKRVSKESRIGPHKETPDGKLTFDPLTPEDEGYYVCQADITSQHADSEEVYVKAKIRPKRRFGKKASISSLMPLVSPSYLFSSPFRPIIFSSFFPLNLGLQVTKEPRSYAVPEGGQLSLSCEAKQTAGGEGPLHYQWYHNGRAIAGATSSSYKK